MAGRAYTNGISSKKQVGRPTSGFITLKGVKACRFLFKEWLLLTITCALTCCHLSLYAYSSKSVLCRKYETDGIWVKKSSFNLVKIDNLGYKFPIWLPVSTHHHLLESLDYAYLDPQCLLSQPLPVKVIFTVPFKLFLLLRTIHFNFYDLGCKVTSYHLFWPNWKTFLTPLFSVLRLTGDRDVDVSQASSRIFYFLFLLFH